MNREELRALVDKLPPEKLDELKLLVSSARVEIKVDGESRAVDVQTAMAFQDAARYRKLRSAHCDDISGVGIEMADGDHAPLDPEHLDAWVDTL